MQPFLQTNEIGLDKENYETVERLVEAKQHWSWN